MPYCVYIMTNEAGTVLYTGVTSNLPRRAYEHKSKLVPGFTSKYNVSRLVYYEATEERQTALLREKQIKAGSRARKVALINALNPEWHDLYDQILL